MIEEEDPSLFSEEKEKSSPSIKKLVKKYLKRELASFHKGGNGSTDPGLWKLVEESLAKQEILELQLRGEFLSNLILFRYHKSD